MIETMAGNQINIPIYYHPAQYKIFSSLAQKKVIAKGRRFGLTKGYANRAIEYLLDILFSQDGGTWHVNPYPLTFAARFFETRGDSS